MTLKLKSFLLIGVMLVLSACSSSPRYSWGSYEDQVYNMYMNPDKALPETQIRRLENDLRRISREGGYVGPGLHAHLGYMHYLIRNFDVAEQYFERELALFPESKVFVERLRAGLPKDDAI